MPRHKRLRGVFCFALAALLWVSSAAPAAGAPVDIPPGGNPKEGSIPAQSYFYVTEYYVIQGLTVLQVNACKWTSQASIAIGLYACNATTACGAAFQGVITDACTIDIGNLLSGIYWMYVYNYGAEEISFEMYYELYT